MEIKSHIATLQVKITKLKWSVLILINSLLNNCFLSKSIWTSRTSKDWTLWTYTAWFHHCHFQKSKQAVQMAEYPAFKVGFTSLLRNLTSFSPAHLFWAIRNYICEWLGFLVLSDKKHKTKAPSLRILSVERAVGSTCNMGRWRCTFTRHTVGKKAINLGKKPWKFAEKWDLRAVPALQHKKKRTWDWKFP